MSKRKRTCPTVHQGGHSSVSLDTKTLDRITYAIAAAGRLFDLPASVSTIIRAAIAHYVQHLEDDHVGKRYEARSFASNLNDPEWSAERGRLMRANCGGALPWTDFPTEELEAKRFPRWSELEQKYRAARGLTGLPPIAGSEEDKVFGGPVCPNQ